MSGPTLEKKQESIFGMKKKLIFTISEKNRIINNIINAMLSREHFLVVGHKNPDEDCISSMVAFALLVRKFNKDVRICLGSTIHEHFQYLLNICKYNSIHYMKTCDLGESPLDTIIVCDTPKPSMVETDTDIILLLNSPDVLKIEFDHHIGTDSEYIGDEGYCMVTEASSTSELIGYLAFKLRNQKDLLKKYQITDLFSRNLILAILTGIIGESQKGKLLKSKREKRYYSIFSNIFNTLLVKETTKPTNFSNMEEIYRELQRSSTKEETCFNYIMEKKRFSSSIGYVILTQDDVERLRVEWDSDTIVSVSRSAANILAEESGRFSLVVYYDDPGISDLIQFRMRRSRQYKSFDLRNVLDLFSIQNGGGHEGAIGFRIPKKDIDNLQAYVCHLIEGIEKAIV